MNNTTRKSLLVALLLGATTVHAEFWDGNRLLERLNSTSLYHQGSALGYIMGVSDTMQNLSHCPPPNVTAGQMQDIVTNYLNNVPAQRHKSGDVIVLTALKAAFPCENNRRGTGL